MSFKSYSAAMAALVVILTSVSRGAALRIADWNVGNKPNDQFDQAYLSTVISFAGASHPIDIMALAETDTASGPLTADTFTSAYGRAYTSIMAPVDGGGDRTGFVYNPATVSLISSTTIGGITHPALRAQFRPAGTTGSADFYMYSIHLQSGTSSTIKNQRVSQAQILRNDADALGSANVIFGGDFNCQKADDVSAGVGAFRTFNAPGDGQVFDPVNQVGSWHANASYKNVMTNDPQSNMDDRFDMQLISGELTDGAGLDYVPGSYHVVGNDGSFTMGSAIDSGSGAPSDVLAALKAFDDHLPVVADYSILGSGPPSTTIPNANGPATDGSPWSERGSNWTIGGAMTTVPEPGAAFGIAIVAYSAFARRAWLIR